MQTLQEYADDFFGSVNWTEYIVESEDRKKGEFAWEWTKWPEREFKAVIARAIADALEE